MSGDWYRIATAPENVWLEFGQAETDDSMLDNPPSAIGYKYRGSLMSRRHTLLDGKFSHYRKLGPSPSGKPWGVPRIESEDKGPLIQQISRMIALKAKKSEPKSLNLKDIREGDVLVATESNQCSCVKSGKEYTVFRTDGRLNINCSESDLSDPHFLDAEKRVNGVLDYDMKCL